MSYTIDFLSKFYYFEKRLLKLALKTITANDTKYVVQKQSNS